MSSQATQDRPALAYRILGIFRREWIAWALLSILARGLLLASFADVFGYGEEPEVACAAKAMLDGLPVPHHQLAYRYFEGGGFVVSHLDALAFAVLGEGLLAIKLVALGILAAIFAASWTLCERLGGRNAARIFAVMFILAPASVDKLSLLAIGSHFQSLLFVALLLDATARILLKHDLRPRAWLRLGFVAGFGLYFSYQLALTIVVALIALGLVLRSDLFRKSTWFCLLGFTLGVSPLIWMAAHVGSAVFDIHGSEVGVEVGALKLDTLREFLVSVFAGRGPFDWISLLALCASPLLGFMALRASAPRGLRIGAWIVLAHILLFLLAYLASGFTVGHVYHYFVLNRLMPLWWLAAIFTVLGASAAWKSERAWQRSLGAALVGACALAGLVDLQQLVGDALRTRAEPAAHSSIGNLELLARTRPYLYPEYMRKIAPHLAGDSTAKLRVFLNFREPRRTSSHASSFGDAPASPSLRDQGIAMALYGDGALTLEEIERELAAAGVTDPRGFQLGLGPFLRSRFSRDLDARMRAIEATPPATRDALIEAIGLTGIGQVPTADRIAREVQLGLDAKLPEAYFVGVGRRMYGVHGDLTISHYFQMSAGPWMLLRERALAFARTQPEPVASALMGGYDAVYQE
jgi:hypothetical protein